MGQRVQFELRRLLLSGLIICVALALYSYALRMPTDSRGAMYMLALSAVGAAIGVPLRKGILCACLAPMFAIPLGLVSGLVIGLIRRLFNLG